MMETGIEDCYRMVTSVFPDISPDYAKQISLEHSGDSGSAISAIMDNLEQNTPYPKKPIVSLKRKRDGNSEEADPRMTELKKKYANVSLREKAQSAEDIAFV